jgi:transposase-like protein
VTRLTAEWQIEYDAWQKRALSARRYLYVWADGVYLQARMPDATQNRSTRSETLRLAAIIEAPLIGVNPSTAEQTSAAAAA